MTKGQKMIIKTLYLQPLSQYCLPCPSIIKVLPGEQPRILGAQHPGNLVMKKTPISIEIKDFVKIKVLFINF